MTLVVDKFRSLISARAKSSPSGWTSFNAPCCHHRGHGQDTRKRGGLRFDHGIVYNCFNCKYTASWQPGRPLTEKFKSLCRWMGANDNDINTMILEALKTESPDYVAQEQEHKIAFTPKDLPEGALPISEWIRETLDQDLEVKLAEVVQYIVSRGYDPMDHRFYWSPSSGYDNRVIIAFFYHGQIVGNTARRITSGKPKYLSDQHPHFVFNVDSQSEDQQYLFVCEGPFDALSVGGVALLTNDVADQQSRIINSLGHKVIVIPDQDKAGLVLINRAIENGWRVAFPTWDNDVKDCADAVQRYGKLFVLVDAIKTAQSGEIKITMARKQLEAKLKRLEDEEND
jgi:hypothetical protein